MVNDNVIRPFFSAEQVAHQNVVGVVTNFGDAVAEFGGVEKITNVAIILSDGESVMVDWASDGETLMLMGCIERLRHDINKRVDEVNGEDGEVDED